MASCINRLTLLITTLCIMVAISQANDNQSKSNAAPPASKSQQDKGQPSQPAKQMPQSLPSSQYSNSFPLYNTNDELNNAILVPVDFPMQNSDIFEDFPDVGNAIEVDLSESDAAEPLQVDEAKSDDKRHLPRFIGKRFPTRFIGKRFPSRFVGKRYIPRFIGKRYIPRFIGKRYFPRFVGKREAEHGDDDAAPHSIEKRSLPRFVGKRDYEPADVAALLLSGSLSGVDTDDEFDSDGENEEGDCQGKTEMEEKRGFPRFVGKRGLPRFVGKRGLPRFVGKRGLPRFVGKRGLPRFVGKRGLPRFVGKRGLPRFVGKRGLPRFVGKRGLPRFVGKRGLPRFVGKRGLPRFVGKRGFPRFVGKREFGDDGDVADDEEFFNDPEMTPWESFDEMSESRDKKSLFNSYGKASFQDKDIRALMDDWSLAEAIKHRIDNDKRWTSPVTPSLIGKRMDGDDSGFKR